MTLTDLVFVGVLATLLVAARAANAQECAGLYADSLAHPTDCSRYYNLYLMTCPDGELYDTATRRCGPAAESTCGQTTSNTIPTESTTDWWVSSDPTSTTGASTTGAVSTTDSTDESTTEWWVSSDPTTTTGASTTGASSSTTEAGSTTETTESTATETSSTTGATASTTGATASTTEATASTTEATASTTGATASTTEATASTTEATSSTTGASSSSTVPTEGSTTPAPSRYECPAVDDPNTKIRYAHETDCALYYLCVEGRAALYRCTPDSHFSPTRRACRVIEEAGCDRCPPAEVARLPHEDSCELYYRCEDGVAALYTCPSPYLFSRADRVCVPEEEAWCTLDDAEVELTSSEAPSHVE